MQNQITTLESKTDLKAQNKVDESSEIAAKQVQRPSIGSNQNQRKIQIASPIKKIETQPLEVNVFDLSPELNSRVRKKKNEEMQEENFGHPYDSE